MATDTNINEWIGQCLKKVRLEKKLSQKEIAQKTGTHKNHYSVIERGMVATSISFLIKFCEALDTTPDAVLGYDKSESVDPALIKALADMGPDGQRRISEIIRIMGGPLP